MEEEEGGGERSVSLRLVLNTSSQSASWCLEGRGREGGKEGIERRSGEREREVSL